MSEVLPKSIMIHIPHASSIISNTVSSIVYSAITTTGDVTASATKSGIELAGSIIGYGTELVAGSIAGTTVRCVANSYGAVTKHTIAKSSRIGAIGISLIVYTGTVLTTTAVIRGGNIINDSFHYFFKPVENEELL
jgi:hypothetical protein